MSSYQNNRLAPPLIFDQVSGTEEDICYLDIQNDLTQLKFPIWTNVPMFLTSGEQISNMDAPFFRSFSLCRISLPPMES